MNGKIKLCSVFITASLAWCVSAQDKLQVIHAGHVINGMANDPIAKQSILLKNNKIMAIRNGYVSTDGYQVVDLKDKTVMPGLMDMHVHLTYEFTNTSYGERFTKNEAYYAIKGADNAKKTLLAGFTTVRDLGAEPQIITEVRDAIKRGTIIGPRVYAAGKSIATTGGHADPTNGFKHVLTGDPGPKEGVINGYDDALKAIRHRYKEGADVIKLTVTGGVLSLAKSGDNPQFTERELEGIMAAAKDYNFVVAVHAHGVEGMKRAIRAGVHSVEHGTYMDREAMKLMKKHHTYYVPTITAGVWVGDKAKIDGYYPDIVRPKAAAVGPQISKTFSKAYKQGVSIAFGTDAGVFPHGLNGREFGYMVAAGMPEMDAIKSATMAAAKLLRVDDMLGSIEVGKLADIVAVDGNPLTNIKLMESISFVMKDGVIVKQ